MVLCPRCTNLEPQIIIARKVARLCDKCGMALIDIVERMPIQPPMEAEDADSYELSEEEQAHSVEQQEAEEAGELKPAPVREVLEVVEFEEIDGMTGEEVMVLAEKMGIIYEEGALVDNIRAEIKAALAPKQAEKP